MVNGNLNTGTDLDEILNAHPHLSMEGFWSSFDSSPGHAGLKTKAEESIFVKDARRPTQNSIRWHSPCRN